MSAHTLLFPTDFSRGSKEALDLALPIVRKLESRLVLVNVVQSQIPFMPTPDLPPPPSLLDEHLNEHQNQAEVELERWTENLSQQGLTAEAIVRPGETPALTLLEIADDVDADLIVMSSHGRRGFRRFLLGSVTEEVIRRSSCPVLVVRRDPELRDVQFPARIVAAVDFSSLSREVLEMAKSMASTFEQQIDLVHVVHVPVYPLGVFGAGPVQSSTIVDGAAQDQIVAASKEHLEHLYARSPGEKVVARTCIHRGDPGVEILRHAEDNEAGLIVLGSEGHSALDRVLIGSVCDRVLRRAPCPVLVVPRSEDKAGDRNAGNDE